MKCAAKKRSRARACRSLLAALVLSGGALAGAGSAAAADQATPQRAPAAQCKGGQLTVSGTSGTGQARVTVVNKGPKACVLSGFPTIALAGQGAPDRNKPLSVSRTGSAKPVQLAVGGWAASQLTFPPVLGEAAGYCASGAKPIAAPTMVVGVAGTKTQIAPSDGGNFAICGNSVRATAFRAA
ncbi:DUF4232 domain-containing protein [Streptomyces sp. NPDC001523]|uniref:DUF4232 domain-containing protein n=1 Tax=Streptomyces sp. NPDC001523 TaxID=3154383 RepID=UPI0033243FF9